MSKHTSDIGPRLPDGLLIEGVVTSINDDGLPNIAPMGPIVDAEFERLVLRPFKTAITYQNLKRTEQGVFHVTDDVELIAQAAVGQLEPLPEFLVADSVEGVILAAACRWYAFRIESIDDRQERTEIVARVVDQGRRRDFVGFNRAKNAVIEAAIMATRVEFLAAEGIAAELDRLSVMVTKTGGRAEHRAFGFLQNYIVQALDAKRRREERHDT